MALYADQIDTSNCDTHLIDQIGWGLFCFVFMKLCFVVTFRTGDCFIRLNKRSEAETTKMYFHSLLFSD